MWLFQWQLLFIKTGLLPFNTALPVLPTSSWGAGLQPSEVSEVAMALRYLPGAQILHSLLPPLKHKHPQLLVSSPQKILALGSQKHYYGPSLLFFWCHFVQLLSQNGKGWWKCFLQTWSVCASFSMKAFWIWVLADEFNWPLHGGEKKSVIHAGIYAYLKTLVQMDINNKL